MAADANHEGPASSVSFDETFKGSTMQGLSVEHGVVKIGKNWVRFAKYHP